MIQSISKLSPLVGVILPTLRDVVDALVLHAADVAVVVVAIEDSLQRTICQSYTHTQELREWRGEGDTQWCHHEIRTLDSGDCAERLPGGVGPCAGDFQGRVSVNNCYEQKETLMLYLKKSTFRYD